MTKKTISLPLLHDHHSHPLFYASFRSGVSLESVSTKSKANEIIGGTKTNQHGIILAHGWRSNFFNWTEPELEKLPPVAIFNLSLHSLLINSAGRKILLKQYGPEFNKVDDEVWFESNLRVVLNWFANLNASSDALVSFFDDLEKQGVFVAEEMLLVDEREIEFFEQTGLTSRTSFWSAPSTYDQLSRAAQSKVHGLKLFTDGAIGSETAALKRPYLNSTNLGLLVYSDKQLTQEIVECLKRKPNLAIHAIGDRAIEQVLNSLEAIGKHKGQLRIEHAQLISKHQARRAKELGVCLSMQPNFSSDSVAYSDRLDQEYCENNNPFRMLIDEVGFRAGEDLILGSDGMPHGMDAAIEQSFQPAFATQCLKLAEFEAAYCVQSPTVAHIEKEIEFSTDWLKDGANEKQA